MNRIKNWWIISLGGLLLLSIIVVSNPYLRRVVFYNFTGIDDYELFANRVVKNGEPQPWPVSERQVKHMPGAWADSVERLRPVAFLVIQGGEILFEHYWDGYSDSSYSNSFSMAKSVVGLLVGVALDEGHIRSLEQAVGDFLPAYNTKQNRQLTLRHLLTMSSAELGRELRQPIFDDHPSLLWHRSAWPHESAPSSRATRAAL